MKLLAIFLGGGFGSLSRYYLSVWLNPVLTRFPLGTFVANVLSCLIVGLTMGMLQNKMNEKNELLIALIIVGFCGGFSTFSTFSREGMEMIKASNYLSFTIYSLTSLCVCLGGVGLGLWLSKG